MNKIADDPILQDIWQAVRDSDVVKVRALFEAHSNFLDSKYGSDTWLTAAVRSNSIDMVEMLLDLGCDIELPASQRLDNTPLISAITQNNQEIAKALLHRGADVTKGRPVITAITGQKKNSLEFIKLLEQYGADIHKVFPFGEGDKINALKAAITWGKQDVVDYLKSKGAVLPDEPLPETAPQRESSKDEVVAFFEMNFGPVDPLAIIEIVPTEPRITVHCVPAAEGRNFITLFTVGMSRQPMTVPEGGEDYQFAELFIQLPADWPYRDLHDPNHAWPVTWLRDNAQYPHLHNTWLGGPVALIANSDPRSRWHPALSSRRCSAWPRNRSPAATDARSNSTACRRSTPKSATSKSARAWRR